jgi:hypothetical protein
VITGQTLKFHLLRLLLAAVLVELEGVVVLLTIMEMTVDQGEAAAVRVLEARPAQGQVVLQHLDRVIMEVPKLYHIFLQWAEGELVQLVDRPLEAQRLELLDLVVLVIVILEPLMLVVEAEAHKVEQEEQAEAEEEEMAERRHKMVLMDRQARAVAAAVEAQLEKLAALEVAGLL